MDSHGLWGPQRGEAWPRKGEGNVVEGFFFIFFFNTSCKIRSLIQQTHSSGLSCARSQLKSSRVFSLHLIVSHDTHFYYGSQSPALHHWLLRLWNRQISCGEELVCWNHQPCRPAVNYSVFHLVSVDYLVVANINLKSFEII